MDNSVAVTISGIGLCTSLGGYRDACAAFRAGINRFSVHENISVMFPGEEEANPVTIAAAANVMLGYQGVGRLIKLLVSAYNDLVDEGKVPIPKEDLLILLAMPDPEDRNYTMYFTEELTREQRLQQYTDLIIGPLFDKVDKELHAAPMQMVFGDRVAFARVLKKAQDVLAEGKAKHCLIMTADSFLNEETLYELLRENHIKTSDNPVGFIPGEGAAMVLLSRSPAESRGKQPSPALFIDVAVDNTQVELNDDSEDESDNHALQVWQDGKLIQLIRSVLNSKYEDQLFPQLALDLNGNEGRALEYGLTQVALKRDYPKSAMLSDIVPALSFGEVGAMSGPLALALILASVQRGYAHHQEFLVCLTEVLGRRAVIKLRF